jgi:cytochrome c oxidase subunit 2
MKRDLAIIAFFSIVLTIVGELLVQANYLPAVDSDKGVLIDESFRVLMRFGIPVFVIVGVALIYLVLRYRRQGDPTADGPVDRGGNLIPSAWVVVTSGLAVTLMIYPGLTGLPAIVANPPNPDLVVQVQGIQWAWVVTYPASGVVSHNELVLPVNRTVQFQLTAKDVIHDFWIPAFRMHMDTVPGMTTLMTLRPTQLGSFSGDPDLRLQCAQLCGLGHAVMTMPVRVVSDADFSAWLAQRSATASIPVSPASAALALGSESGNGGSAPQ